MPPALRRSLAALAAIGVLAAIGYGIWSVLAQKSAVKKPAVQQITLIKPPPPPPPPKVEPKPPPEPPKPKEEVKLDQPKPDPVPKSEAPPPSEQLGVDAKGTGAGDSFGIVGNPGGRSITETAPVAAAAPAPAPAPVIGGAPRADYTAYIGRLQKQIEDALARNDKLRAVPYRVAIRISFNADGTFRGISLDDSTGDADADAALRSALASISLTTETGSPRLPREARIRITNRI